MRVGYWSIHRNYFIRVVTWTVVQWWLRYIDICIVIAIAKDMCLCDFTCGLEWIDSGGGSCCCGRSAFRRTTTTMVIVRIIHVIRVTIMDIPTIRIGRSFRLSIPMVRIIFTIHAALFRWGIIIILWDSCCVSILFGTWLWIFVHDRHITFWFNNDTEIINIIIIFHNCIIMVLTTFNIFHMMDVGMTSGYYIFRGLCSFSYTVIVRTATPVGKIMKEIIYPLIDIGIVPWWWLCH